MEWEPGARGTVIGDRYRVAGELRRRGLLEAIDLDASATEAACRVVAVPGIPEQIDAWQTAWRSAEGAARLPRLRDVVADDQDGAWAVLDPSPIGTPVDLPPDARRQARIIGAALARAGLDPSDVTAPMLIADGQGEVRVDGIVWLGPDTNPKAAGQLLAALLPADDEEQHSAPDEPIASPVPRRRRRERNSRSRRRILVPLLIALALLGAALALVLPAGSTGTPNIEPEVLAPAAFPADALLGIGTAPPTVEVNEATTTAAIVEAPPDPVTVTVIAPADAAPVEAGGGDAVVPEGDAVSVPPAAAQVPSAGDAVPVLPLAGDVAVVPSAG